MKPRERYPVSDNMRLICKLLNISTAHVLRRAKLPADYLETEARGLAAAEWFTLWQAVEAEYGQPDFALRLGKTLAQGPFVSAIFAFSCSPNIEIGLSRLSLFKPLIGPIRLDVARTENSVVISFRAVDPKISLPAACSRFEAVYFLQCCRIFTGEHIVPRAIGAPGARDTWEPLIDLLGVSPTTHEHLSITLSIRDATLPLITRNDEMWTGVEASLQKKMAQRQHRGGMAQRVRNALLESLPSGQKTADDICARLHVSKRTLQRRLKEEQTSFQEILDETRTQLSHHYLKDKSISVVEISYLLGFSDPGSFYRAFQAWTGQTPADVRNQLIAEAV